MFDEIGYVYGHNPFHKFKAAKLMNIRLSIVKYLQKVRALKININEVLFYYFNRVIIVKQIC